MLWDVDGAYSMLAYTRLDFRHIRALFVGLNRQVYVRRPRAVRFSDSVEIISKFHWSS